MKAEKFCALLLAAVLAAFFVAVGLLFAGDIVRLFGGGGRRLRPAVPDRGGAGGIPASGTVCGYGKGRL